MSFKISDLEATAKGDGYNICHFGYLKVGWDETNKNFSYWFKDERINREQAADILQGN